MPSTPPEGEPAPPDGGLPAQALADLGNGTPFGVYLHVPFCASRCGYCDFNTYTAAELGGGASQAEYVDTALRELDLAGRVVGAHAPPVSTVFFGGGTPTLLPAADLVRLLDAVRRRFAMASDVEVTTEANPESVDAAGLRQLRDGGFTRVSFGMQSARPHVLAVLDRRHTPGRVAEAVAEAQAAGFEHVNVDLIYATPGESDDDWQASLDAAVATGVDHVSAYSLIVEDGTRLAARVRRHELPPVDDDVAADRYLRAEETLRRNGFEWYEVSNWARGEDARSRHNLLYWTGGSWWGVGPGAHSHVGGVRWWNVRHPREYAGRLAAGMSPAQGREHLDVATQQIERVMLRIRLRSGMPVAALPNPEDGAVARLAQRGLLDRAALEQGRLVLTLQGRLLGDAVVRELVA